MFVYPLRPDCREVLTAPLELPRLMAIARDFWVRPMASIAEAFGSAS